MYSDPRLSGYLSRALSHELAAVQQYLMQSKLVALWGMADMSARMRSDVNEELVHAERLMTRMLILGIPSNATQLPPVRTGRSIEEMLQIDRVLEVEAIHLYEEMMHYCSRIRDYETHALCADILKDELGHLGELDRMLVELQKGAA